MLRLRPYKYTDANTILSWCKNETMDELRFGFVIVDPEKRGKGYGKEMLHLGLKYVFEIYQAKKATLGVFENNIPAYQCYKAVGLKR